MDNSRLRNIKYNFNETYLTEGFFDDLEDDLDNSDIVTTQITDIISCVWLLMMSMYILKQNLIN